MEKIRAFSMSLRRGVVFAKEESTAHTISNLMAKYDIGAVPIMRGDKLVGIVSERDIVRRVVGKGLNPNKIKAKDFMTKNVVYAEFKDGLKKIYQILCKSEFRHLPILENGRLVGIASQRDVLLSLVLRKECKSEVKDERSS